MIIIVEGIDRVGKSTLIEKIKNETNFHVYKDDCKFSFDKMDNDNETDKMLKILKMYSYGTPGVIFDRFHYTDFVYGCLERNYQFKNALINKDKIESQLKVLKACLILVEPTDVEQSSMQHGSDLRRHQTLFKMLFDESKLEKFVCNYETFYDAIKWTKDEVNYYLNGRW